MSTPRDRIDSHLPLTPAAFQVLLCLAAGPRHGYAIMREVEETTDGRVALGPGTLYGTIKRLRDAGLIRESAQRPDPEDDDSRRRYYELTALGRRVAAAEAARLEDAVARARARRLLPAELADDGVTP